MNDKSILIAEDDDGIYELVSSELLENGWQTQRAETGARVLDLIKTEPPYILILDYMLPDMDGQELIETAGRRGIPMPPFIISTGRGDENLAVRMMKLGARDYVVKDSIFLDHLANAVERLDSEITNKIMLDLTRKALGASEALLFALFNQAPISILILDPSGQATDANDSFRNARRIETNESLARLNVLRDTSCIRSGFTHLVEPAFRGRICKEYECSYICTETDPPDAVYNLTAFPVMESGSLQSVVVLEENVTARFNAEKKALHLSMFDPLTGLPNRQHLLDRIADRLAYMERYSAHDALLLVNIDRFKIINDARGNLAGDNLIMQSGRRLRNALREIDFIGRTAADEFAILLPLEGDTPEKNGLKILSAAERLRQTLLKPFLIDGENLPVTASIGITFFPEESATATGNRDTPHYALARASTALHRAKDAGGNQCAFFERGMGMNAKERFTVERELSEENAEDGFLLYLQPQVSRNGTVVGAECLIRWQHPVRGLLAPGSFIPIAEDSDLIVKIGEWVLRKACIAMTQIKDTQNNFRISVNISPRHFMKPGFKDWIIALFSEHSLHPSRIMLEITEGLFLSNTEVAIRKMNELVDLGFVFSIDDFGTGYSSLAYLKKLPLRELKIDKSFVQDAPDEPNDAALVESIIAVAQNLGLEIVAEGVETEQQADFLASRGDMLYQGYFFGKPVPAADLLSNLATQP